MRAFPLGILILLLVGSCKEEEPIVVPDQEIQSFFSHLDIFKRSESDGFTFHEKPFVIDSILADPDWVSDIVDKEVLLSKEDKNFIKKQLLNKTVFWTRAIIKENDIVSGQYIDSIGYPNPLEQTPPHLRVSLPFFSRDKRYCILYYDLYCGNLCAETCVRLYEKVNGRWESVKQYGCTVS